MIVFVDSYDVMVHPMAKTRLDTLAKKFVASPTSVLVGAESFCAGNCLPLNNWWARQRDRKGTLQYANAGCVAGRPKALKNMYSWILAQEPPIQDDQLGVCTYMNEVGSKDTTLDVTEQLVTNFVGSRHFWGYQQEMQSAFAHFPSPVTKYGFSFAYNYWSPRWTSYPSPPYFFAYSEKQRKEIVGKLFQILAIFLLLLFFTLAS